MRFQRCKLLFGDDFQKITSSNIIIFGVGGVGSFCLDALYRSGVKNITIVDYDTYELSNQNRQIGSENVGEKKVDILSKLYPGIKKIDVKVTKEWINSFDFKHFDLVVDAIDDIPAKVAIAHKTYKKLISSLGGAKRVNPTKIEYSSIWKTSMDPFGRKFRYELKKSNFKGDFHTVFSKEPPKSCDGLGSFVGVTGSMGLALASLAINKLISIKS